MAHRFNPTILREYDIRGIVGDTLTEADAYALGRTYGSKAHGEGARTIAVGRDGRLHSGMLEAELIRGLTESGVNVMLVGMGPSPMLYFATYYLDVDGGIQVTGSHNPADYNGFKLLLKGRSVFGDEIQEIGERSAAGHWIDGSGTVEEVDIREAYVNRLLEGFLGSEFRIGWDAGNGAAGPILDMLVESLPGQHHVIFSQVDGAFPNHHPDPTVEKNLADLKALVEREQLDFGIAFDGDGDRIGAVDGQGRVIWGDQLLAILAEPVLKEQPGATIIADVKASQVLFDRVEELGGTPLMWKTGHSLIKSKMKETGAPLAGEMSGHIFFKHRWYGFDDALYAAVRLIEAVSASGKTLIEIMDAMPKTIATPEMRFQVDESRKFAIVDEVRERLSAEGATVDATDGVRVSTSDGWWLLRASNTQEVLVARAEAQDQAGVGRLIAQIDDQLTKSGVQRLESDH
jgi:phosphomannomutase